MFNGRNRGLILTVAVVGVSLAVGILIWRLGWLPEWGALLVTVGLSWSVNLLLRSGLIVRSARRLGRRRGPTSADA